MAKTYCVREIFEGKHQPVPDKKTEETGEGSVLTLYGDATVRNEAELREVLNIQTFPEEASELLSNLEASPFELGEDPYYAGLMGRVFRALQTINVSGAMFGFDEAANFAHTMEKVFADVREVKLSATGELISLALRSKDLIRFIIDAPSDEASAPYEAKKLIGSFKDISSGKNVSSNAVLTENPSLDKKAKEASSTPFQGPAGELKLPGKRRIFAKPDNVQPVDDTGHEQCYEFADVVLTNESCPRFH